MIINNIQTILSSSNVLVRSFTNLVERSNVDNSEFSIKILADAQVRGIHQGRLNVPTSNEIAAIVPTFSSSNSRDIILNSRLNQEFPLKRITETHMYYDSLQYPLIHWDGLDGYDFNYKLYDPQTGHFSAKKLSSHKFYKFRRTTVSNRWYWSNLMKILFCIFYSF